MNQLLLLLSLLIQGLSIMASNMHHQNSCTFITTEPGIKQAYFLNEFRICATQITAAEIEKYLSTIAQTLNFIPRNKNQSIILFTNEDPTENQADIEGVFFGKQGTIHAHYWRKPRLITVTIQDHNKNNSSNSIIEITKKFFGLIESSELAVHTKNGKEENKKVEVRTDHPLGRGLFATQDIAKGEFIGGLYGAFHEAPDAMSLPEDCRDHVMQCGNTIWRGNEFETEAVQYLNHSCDPNCGVQGLFDFVAMRDIKAGEELTTDYAMQDDSNWEIPDGGCLCGASTCRNEILPYRKLSPAEKDAYNNYVSHWLLHKYTICSCPK